MRSVHSRWFDRAMASMRRVQPQVEASPTLVGWEVIQAGSVFGVVATEAEGYAWSTVDGVTGTCLTFGEGVSRGMGVELVEGKLRS